MTKAWRVVLWIALALLVAGVVLMGAGWLTGASLPRMADMVFGSADAAKSAAHDLLTRLAALWDGLVSAVGAWF